MNTDIYSADGGTAYHQGKRLVPDYVHELVSDNRRHQFGPYVKATDDVLEFGVGAGWNLAKLTAKSKTGYDVATAMRDQVERFGIRFTSDLASLEEKSFDVILCNHVLEHVPDPLGTLRQMLSMLKPGKELVLCVPTDLSRKYHRFDRADKDRHLFSWNNQTLSMLVEEAGFEVIETKRRPFGYSVFAAKLVNRFGLPSAAYRPIWQVLNLAKPCPEVMVRARRPL